MKQSLIRADELRYSEAVNAIFGPSILNIYPENSNIYLLLNFMYDAGYYFSPIFVGINAAKQLNVERMLGGYMGRFLFRLD